MRASLCCCHLSAAFLPKTQEIVNTTKNKSVEVVASTLFTFFFCLAFVAALRAEFIVRRILAAALIAKRRLVASRGRFVGSGRPTASIRSIDCKALTMTKRLLAGRAIDESVCKPRTKIQLIVHIFYRRFTLIAYSSIRQTATPASSFE